jgi:hypothetical protein
VASGVRIPPYPQKEKNMIFREQMEKLRNKEKLIYHPSKNSSVIVEYGLFSVIECYRIIIYQSLQKVVIYMQNEDKLISFLNEVSI